MPKNKACQEEFAEIGLNCPIDCHESDTGKCAMYLLYFDPPGGRPVELPARLKDVVEDLTSFRTELMSRINAVEKTHQEDIDRISEIIAKLSRVIQIAPDPKTRRRGRPMGM